MLAGLSDDLDQIRFKVDPLPERTLPSGRDLRAMEFQVGEPMKPNLKPGLVFSGVHFPIGKVQDRRCNAIYSVRIGESVIECWPSGRLAIQT